MKCGSFLSYPLQRRGETAAAVREIERVWALGSEALGEDRVDQELVFLMNAIGPRYIELLEKVGRQIDATRVREANAKIPRNDRRLVAEGESKRP